MSDNSPMNVFGWSTLIWCLVLGFTTLRLYFGIDFTDEAYYIAMPLRFARGDQPFIDELFINQTAAIFVVPLVKLFLKLKGNTDSIILYIRFCYLSFSLLMSLHVYQLFKRISSHSIAILISASALAIIPLNIPALSYNSIGSLSFTCALMLGVEAYLSQKKIAFFLTGLYGAVATTAYPSLLIPVVIFIILMLGKHQSRQNFKWITLGGSLVFLSFLPYIYRAGMGLVSSLVYTLNSFDHGGGVPKLVLVLKHIFIQNLPIEFLFVFLLLGLIFIFQSHPELNYSLLALPLLCIYPFLTAVFTQLWFVFYFSLTAPFLLAFVPHKTNRNLFYLIWLPSMLGAIVIAWTSSSAALNGGLALTPAFLLSCYFLIQIFKVNFQSEIAAMTCQTLVVSLLLFTQFFVKSFYRDQNFFELTERVKSGPYAGLYTSKAKFDYLTQITADIKSLENKNGKIVFYEFPAGYLISEMRPGVNSAWIRDISRGKKFYSNYYEKHQTPDSLVFEIDWLTHEKSRMQKIHYSPNDALYSLIEKTHHLLLARPDYRVLSPRNPNAS